ncbi:peroxiredoxin family protein [Photobacterium galatheae]|uniref:Thioredoxin domain-containing protein n=1 Tax=Photobacterium galatheae TaxID=1654360 RepID=A0A066RYK0_9GAMM|nr:redoxin domain-containing protein [Photobacterium galatheae]KDM92473.1 hypothetical protein EA58_05900 [Photobacterium galatheae]MCM0147952.1 redoxin domain-containing protein [Photobacterium galatheae]
MKRLTILYTLPLLASLCFSALVQSEPAVSLLEKQQTLAGTPVQLNENRITHLVFIEIWASYAGSGPEAFVASLPESFQKRTDRIWVQPEINVTRAQLLEFQGYYPQVAPIVLDRGRHLLTGFGLWQTPAHVLIEKGKVVFSGSNEALLDYLEPGRKTAEAKAQTWDALQPPTTAASTPVKAKPYVVPHVGDTAPLFQRQTMSDQPVSLAALLQQGQAQQPVSLVFLDALCPMPHFPDCEQKIAQWKQLMAKDSSRQWVGVISGYYIDASIASAFAEKFGLTAPLIFDTDNSVFTQYGIHATPYQVDVGSQGRILYRGDQLR